MGWSIGYVDGRDIGYGVPCTCEYPSCNKKIDRGLSYACGGFPGEDEQGCGQFFCSKHMYAYLNKDGEYIQACNICCHNYTLPEELISTDWRPEYPKKPDRAIWIRWKLKHNSWQQWRDENPQEVKLLKEALKA